jgi:mono/diheme cytochrome c family protein
VVPLPPDCNKKSMLPNSGREMGSTAGLSAREITRCIAIVLVLTVFLPPGYGWVFGAAATNAPKESLIRVGREIAVESCTGCHMATRRQEFHPAVADAIPSFEEIANRPGATVVSLRETFDTTHRGKDAPPKSSISSTTYISDIETLAVIEYILTQKHMP